MNVSALPQTLADVVRQLGDIELSRIRMRPAPGTATPDDVASIKAHEQRLFELVDGVLVEKVMGFRESLVAIFLARILGNFISPRNLGLVVGADGMMRLQANTVRIPDVAFIAWSRLPEGKVPQTAVPDVVPTLAVEVLSATNTAAEMSRKRREYFAAGVELVWEVDIHQRIVTVYTSAESLRVIRDGEILSGGRVLPEFEIPLSEIFAELDRQQGGAR
jgi:Uma2 family endonuclease